jgi:hypothetical protein
MNGHLQFTLTINERSFIFVTIVVRSEEPAMKKNAKRRFAAKTLSAIRDCQIIGIRAGLEPHRFIGIWVVVVEGRVFVRSWSLKPRSWYRTFLEVPQGAIQVGDREIRIRAARPRSERLLAAIDRAYLEKYHTPGSIQFARDLSRAKSRATTTELVPR